MGILYVHLKRNPFQLRGSLVLNNLPAKVQSSNGVFEFKIRIKNLGNINCGCVICK